MSNRADRNRTKLSGRISRLFKEDVHISWTGNQALVWFYKDLEQGTGRQEFILQPYGDQYRIKASAADFAWQGPRLKEGLNQVKLVLMLTGS